MESDFVAFPFIIGKAIYKKGKFTQGFWRFAGFPCIDSGFQAQTWESMWFCLFMPCCVHRFLNSGPDFHHFQVLQYP